MEKIVILSCTTRKGSNTLKVSRIYARMLEEMGVATEVLDLRSIPDDLLVCMKNDTKSQELERIINGFIVPHSKFLFVVPEYNGSFPGILKILLDNVNPKLWTGKYACLTGVATGRAGNLRGMDHLTGVLNYLKIHVYHNKLPISQVDKIIGNDDRFENEIQQDVCKMQLKGFLEWVSEK